MGTRIHARTGGTGIHTDTGSGGSTGYRIQCGFIQVSQSQLLNSEFSMFLQLDLLEHWHIFNTHAIFFMRDTNIGVWQPSKPILGRVPKGQVQTLSFEGRDRPEVGLWLQE